MDEHQSSTPDVIERCSAWLESCSLDSCEAQSCCSCSDISISSKLTSDSDSTNNSAMQSGFTFLTDKNTIGNISFNKSDDSTQLIHVSSLLGQNKIPENSKIQIYKSRKVHIGDVNYINGPIFLNGVTKNDKNEVKEENTVQNVPDAPFYITERRSWLAQPPLERNTMKEPAKHVIICHSATEGAFTIAENVLLVRLIQSFHMDSRKWSDIGYNFLIGEDGSIFEGRGWNIIGAHTRQYNSTSLGICFIGTFIRHMPSQNAIRNAKKLIEYGVSIGAIGKDYSLLGHCQCIGTESPGEALFAEIKNWKNFDSSVSLRNPSFALPSLKNVDDIHVP